MGRYLAVFLALVAVLAAPVLLKPAASARPSDFPPADRLVLLSPHTESIRAEFETAFARWMLEKHGRKVVLDWRVPGGTSEITKVIASDYRAALEHYWQTKRSDPWKAEYGRSFMDPSDKTGARSVWMKSEVGIGVDLFFGGGPVDFAGVKRQGCIVASDASGKYGVAGVKTLHPDWFTDSAIPAVFTGEPFYDPEFSWTGTCLSSFGICYNTDALRRLGIPEPRVWGDLTSPVFENGLALADPGKSGTVVKMFENVLQQEMQRTLKDAPADKRKEALAKGWTAGMEIIRRIGANARYWTDAATKIPMDVCEGEAAAGLCVDFYGRSYIERLQRANSGESRMKFIMPEGGTGQSVDPVAMLRGAPNPELATRFIEFVLSMEGQRLWAYRVGEPGGPRRTALRRLPVRKDFYTPENEARSSDPDINPYLVKDPLVYDPALTSSSFTAIRLVIRAMCLDTHLELKEAWAELVRHKFPPRATAAFNDLSAVSYANVTGPIAEKLKQRDSLVTAELSRTLAQQFRGQYLLAAELARKGQ